MIIPSDSFFDFFKQAGFASNTRFGVPPVYAYGGGNDKGKGNAATTSKNADYEFRKNALALAQQLGFAPKTATVAPTTTPIYKAVAETPLSFQQRIIPNYIPDIEEIITQEMQNNAVAADNTSVNAAPPPDLARHQGNLIGIRDGRRAGIDGLVDAAKDVVLGIAVDPIIDAYLHTPDYSNMSYDDAWYEARKKGVKRFKWDGDYYNTTSDWSPQEQLDRTGITNEQLQDRGWFKERLSNNLYPVGYEPGETKFEQIIKTAKRAFNALLERDPRRDELEIYAKNNYIGAKERIDAYNLYTGKPMEYNTLMISEYAPSIAKDKNKTYYKIVDEAEIMDNINTYSPMLNHYNYSIIDDRLMGKMKIQKGVDEKGRKYISYYDKWDMNPLRLSMGDKEIPTNWGEPMEFYNRIYYRDNPEFKKYFDIEEVSNAMFYVLNYNWILDNFFKTFGIKSYDEIDESPYREDILESLNILEAKIGEASKLVGKYLGSKDKYKMYEFYDPKTGEKIDY
ncbi:MAG: hypothetical protein LBR36_08960 [Bacteroidales bacterium]|nr:hypothetical protein [Bacteroidales bacterium]